jgi:hypothetical protein
MLAQASKNTSGDGGGGDVLMRERKREKYVENPPVPYHRLAVRLTISAENFNLKQEDAISTTTIKHGVGSPFIWLRFPVSSRGGGG